MINENWFKKIVKDWTPETVWEKESLKTACTLLAEISSFNGGDIIKDTDISQHDKAVHAVNRAKEAIQRQMNLYAKAGKIHIPERHYGKEIKLEDNKLLEFLRPKELLYRVELNSATLEELDGLPGIGKVTGARIIEYREKVVPFSTLEEVRNIKGISKNDFETFHQMVYLRSPSEKPTFHFEPLKNFYDDPSFENYLLLKIEQNATFLEGEDVNATIQERIIGELREIRRNTSIYKYPPRKTLPLTMASSAKQEISTIERKQKVESNAITSRSYGRLIFDRQYAPFMEELLSGCKKSLYMIMFFFRFEDKGDYPTDPLVKRIMDAHKKGADVKVILDIDEADDPYNSEKINSEIFKYLKNNGVKVLFDQPETVTHSKTIIMDSRHVVVGSHNWTAGSFYQYDDTSVYLDSNELAENYIHNFNNRWESLSQLDQ